MEQIEQEAGELRLERQLAFVMEIDKLKSILRRTYITDKSRRENSGEHSWHFALMALVLAEYANEPDIDVLHAVKMALVHDIVEIDAGDTFLYDTAGASDKAEREQAAALRIFGMLPDDQRDELMALWREFEERRTPEARYAAAVDRLQPMMHNYYTGGAAWREHGIRSAQVLELNSRIAEGSERLWAYARRIIQDSVDKGYLER